MAIITYGDARYEMPDGMAKLMQKIISALLEEERSGWYPVAVVPSEADQPTIVDLLVGSGIPVSVAFTYDTEDDLDVELRERFAKLPQVNP